VAAQDLAAVQSALAREFPQTDAGWSAEIASLKEARVGSARRGLVLVFGAVAALWVIAVANVAGLSLVQVRRRSREMAIRAALGADRRAIATMVLKDGLRPVAEGLVIGLGVATAIRAIMQMTVARGLSSIDAAAFGLAAVVLIAAALAACVLPARRATKVDPNIALRDL
jgi:putative ABC transport system permease protein